MEKQLFSIIEPSENLKSSILNKIQKEETKKTVYKIVLNSVASLASVSTAVFFVVSIVNDAYQSGLTQYLSLIFSDGASIVSYWQAYTMSIAESLPIIPITMVVASVWIFVWSMNSVLETFKSTRQLFYKVS